MEYHRGSGSRRKRSHSAQGGRRSTSSTRSPSNNINSTESENNSISVSDKLLLNFHNHIEEALFAEIDLALRLLEDNEIEEIGRDLEWIFVLLDDDGKIVAFEEVKKDINALTKEQQMEVVMSNAPELVGLLSEFKDELDNLKIVQVLLQKVKVDINLSKEGMNYLEVKQLSLLCYCQSIVFYLLLKAEGCSVRDHLVIACLVEIPDFLDKIRPNDNRLGNPFERILKEGNTDSIEGAPAKSSVDFISAEDFMLEFKTSVVGETFKLYTRFTVVVETMLQVVAINPLNLVLRGYDLVAVEPMDEQTFEHACKNLEIDLISIDFAERLPCQIKRASVKMAMESGIFFEIMYALAI